MPTRKNRNRRNREAVDVDAMAKCVLPRKIIASILSRLPVKSLVRFKAVCKPWKTLFTTPDFIKLHYNCFSQLPKTWCANSQILHYRNLGLVPPTPPDIIEGDFFLASCKGLICMGRPDEFNTERVLLWNPGTRMWKILPNTTTTYEGIPETSALGFGCNEECDDYKVVRIHSIRGKKMQAIVEVYSSKSDTWKPVNVGFEFRLLYTKQATSVNGNPYWVVLDEANNIVLLRLDATKMSFTTSFMPGGMIMNNPDSISFVDLGGILGGLNSVKRADCWLEMIDVYEYVNEQWVIKWRLDGEALSGMPVDNCVDYSWRKGKIVAELLNGCFCDYDVNKGTSPLIGVERFQTAQIHMCAFEESLAHVTGMAAMDLATPAADGDGEIKDCIVEGFFTWAVPHNQEAGYDVQVYYPLAF